jgi:hypothetical protein
MKKLLWIVGILIVLGVIFGKADPDYSARDSASAANERREWRNMQRERDADFRQVMRDLSRRRVSPMPTCELHLRGAWTAIDLETALKLDKGRTKRCPECHGQVRAHAVAKNGMVAHFEHYDGHAGCSLGDRFDGNHRPHPRALR